MSEVKKCKSFGGNPIEFEDEVIGAGGMKDVYFSPDRSYVVAFYRDKQDHQAKDRLTSITTIYRDRLFNEVGGNYWKELFCWPTDIVEHAGRLGVVAPTYPKKFFFEYGSKASDSLNIKGKEKEGKWFASPKLRNRFVDPRELGDWRMHLRICVRLARAVRKLHMMGLAHSDLSYKNVLIDPTSGAACVIDVDGLVVPGKYPPDVVGTPDFIAPEVVKTAHLTRNDPLRKLPRRETDCHALAVLIYMYLLYRHPLRGGKIHDIQDEQRDEQLSMGEKALFVEHPSDSSNRIKWQTAQKWELPWADTTKIPYTITGPYLAPLFLQAFVAGLHEPSMRPSANDWETALVKTVDLIQPCQNPACEQRWFVFDNTTAPRCPFCGTPFHGKLPILNFYSSRREGKFLQDNHRLMVYADQSLFGWHTNNLVSPNEKLSADQAKRVGYFAFDSGSWWLVNEKLPDLMETVNKKSYPPGQKVELVDGLQLLFDRSEGGRLAVVQMVSA